MAAYEEAMKTISVPASGDLSASQYCWVKLDSNGRLAVAGADDNAIGILQDIPAALGRAGRVCIAGVSKCVFGGSVTAGNRVTADSAGKSVALTSGDAYSLGDALETSGGTGEIHPVLVRASSLA